MVPWVKPMGIGDLKVTKQALVRYVPGEVAHIENVLARETRGRTHRRLRQVEEIIVLEHEREEESRRDLQTTERFELETETQKTVKSETTFEAGVELSGGFGPVQISAFAKFGTSESTEESDTNSTTYAKEVVDKSMSRLLERVREERQARTLEEVEETNEHGFVNDSGDNVTGVYRWVDKLYRQKVVNYGRRLMYQFVVPEPAAFYLFAQRYNYENKVLPTKPSVPTVPGTSTELTPGAITRSNWPAIVKQTGATGVEPPPPERIVVSKPISREIPQSNTHWAFANEDLAIPKGYKAQSGFYRVVYTWREAAASRRGTIQVGDNVIDIGIYPALAFDGETGKMPISGTGYDIRSFAINVEADCVLIAEHFAAWQLATFNAVMNAYRSALMEYEERVAAAQIQQGVAVGGNNPLINREIEKEELKRSCLTIWVGSAIDLPDGIWQNVNAPVPANYPTILRANAIASASKVEFFEHAFDWRNVAYELHPYFWGREGTWLDRNALQSADPLLERFLKAGAATVTVPVQPSFTEAVLWYQLTGDIWDGGPIPELESTGDPDAALYNSFLSELEDEEDVVDVDAEVVIDPDDPDAWMVRVPTTLVWLQPGPELPDLEPA
jgi:hypothetical protein